LKPHTLLDETNTLWLEAFASSTIFKRGDFDMPIPENLDQKKLAEIALAILSLSRITEKVGVRAWKGMDWDVMNILFEKGWISDPVGKQKSVWLTKEGVELAEQFLEKHFGK
jgi:hypothetical protein